MGVALLDLVETALRVAKQALGNRVGKPDSGGLAREAHIVAHCIRKEEGHSYAELVDRVGLMPKICDRLGIHPDALPDPTTFYHSFDRYAIALASYSAAASESTPVKRLSVRYLWSKRVSSTGSRSSRSAAVLSVSFAFSNCVRAVSHRWFRYAHSASSQER